jgi:hypothetical protein
LLGRPDLWTVGTNVECSTADPARLALQGLVADLSDFVGRRTACGYHHVAVDHQVLSRIKIETIPDLQFLAEREETIILSEPVHELAKVV